MLLVKLKHVIKLFNMYLLRKFASHACNYVHFLVKTQKFEEVIGIVIWWWRLLFADTVWLKDIIVKYLKYFRILILSLPCHVFKGNNKLLNNNLRNIWIKLIINIYYSVLYNAYFQKSNKWLINVKSLWNKKKDKTHTLKN